MQSIGSMAYIFLIPLVPRHEKKLREKQDEGDGLTSPLLGGENGGGSGGGGEEIA